MVYITDLFQPSFSNIEITNRHSKKNSTSPAKPQQDFGALQDSAFPDSPSIFNLGLFRSGCGWRGPGLGFCLPCVYVFSRFWARMVEPLMAYEPQVGFRVCVKVRNSPYKQSQDYFIGVGLWISGPCVVGSPSRGM